MYFLYPAVFEPDEDSYMVTFPDIDGCFTCGYDREHAYRMGQEVLGIMVQDILVESKRQLPSPSAIETIPVPQNGFVSYVSVDFDPYTENFIAYPNHDDPYGYGYADMDDEDAEKD